MEMAMVQKWSQYLLHMKRMSPHTVRAYVADTTQFLIFFQDQKHDLSSATPAMTFHQLISFVTRETIRTWLFTRKTRKITDRSNARAIAALRAFFAFLQEQEGVINEAACLLRSPRLPRLLPKPAPAQLLLQHTAQVAVDHAADGKTIWSLRDYVLYMLIYGCGLRISEALQLNRNNIHGDVLVIYGKGGKERLVPIMSSLLEQVQRYIQLSHQYLQEALQTSHASPLFIGKNGARLNASVVRKNMTQAAAEIHTPKLSPHMLRHSCATDLINAGLDIKFVQELLGHRSIGTTQIYTAVAQKDILSIYKKHHPLESLNID